MSALAIVLALVAVQRFAELLYAQRNTRRLLARGAIEVAPEQHQWFIVLHVAWLVALAVTVPWNAHPSWPLLAVFFILQALRVWVLASLGPYWTTRVITLPGVPLVRKGPYRFVKHPNYAIVAAELAVLPLAFGAWMIAVVFTVLNGILLAWRLRAENAALRDRPSGV